jgi:hypothetical protein
MGQSIMVLVSWLERLLVWALHYHIHQFYVRHINKSINTTKKKPMQS